MLAVPPVLATPVCPSVSIPVHPSLSLSIPLVLWQQQLWGLCFSVLLV